MDKIIATIRLLDIIREIQFEDPFTKKTLSINSSLQKFIFFLSQELEFDNRNVSLLITFLAFSTFQESMMIAHLKSPPRKKG